MSLTGPVATLAKFSQDLKRLPRVVAQKVAAAAAPALTAAGRETFDAGETAYGDAWAPKEDGTRATLVKSGDLSKHLNYVAIGTKLRVALGVRYAKYVIGKRPVFPSQSQGLPQSFISALSRTAVDVCRAELGR